MTLRLTALAATALAIASALHAQDTGRITLPQHNGAMVLHLDGWEVTEMSAKPGGVEVGVRAHTRAGANMLAFLFLTPKEPHQTAASCRAAELNQIAKQKPTNVETYSGARGEEMATVTFATHTTVHAFWASDDQCLAFEVYPDPKAKLDVAFAKAFLMKQGYDPDAKPEAASKLLYAETLFHHHAYAAAVPVYRDLLATLPTDAANRTVRRVATDDLMMSLGISGDIAGSRKALADAIQADPAYPLNYYNLACADAEEGKAAMAKEHLQMAFDRRANGITSERFPDPTQDDSLEKLKSDKAFWALAISISEQLKKTR